MLLLLAHKQYQDRAAGIEGYGPDHGEHVLHFAMEVSALWFDSPPLCTYNLRLEFQGR